MTYSNLNSSVSSDNVPSTFMPAFFPICRDIFLIMFLSTSIKDNSATIEFDVVAGLTSIPASRTTTDSGPSWSGSAGVG